MRSRLRDIRDASGKTQEEVARDLGVALGTYRNWEQGITSLNHKKLEKLREYFGVDISDFFEEGPSAKHESVAKVNDLIEDLSDNEIACVLSYIEYVMWKAARSGD